MKPEAVVKVTAALEGGATISQIIRGRSLRIVDAAILARYRRNNPEFDRLSRRRSQTTIALGKRLDMRARRRAHASKPPAISSTTITRSARCCPRISLAAMTWSAISSKPFLMAAFDERT